MRLARPRSVADISVPIYAVGVLLEAHRFHLAPERWFRAFALGLITAVAIVSLFE